MNKSYSYNTPELAIYTAWQALSGVMPGAWT
jgi:hypothetical protein